MKSIIKIKHGKIPPPPELNVKEFEHLGQMVMKGVIDGVRAEMTPDGRRQKRNTKRTLIKKSKEVGHAHSLIHRRKRFLSFQSYHIQAEEERGRMSITDDNGRAKTILRYLLTGRQFAKGGGGYYGIIGVSKVTQLKMENFIVMKLRHMYKKAIARENKKAKWKPK